MNYSTRQLAEITGSKLIGDDGLIVRNIAFDSRNIFSATNTAFIAINTSKNSGEKFIRSAAEKGVKIIISERKIETAETLTWIIVENSLKFIQKLAKFHLSQFGLKTIGITGSNGKTIVKEWLYQSLFDKYESVKSPKSFNSQLGLPISLLQVNENHELGIFEVGISQPGEMQILSDIFSPEIGILTHIGTAHESNFQDIAELIEEKVKLFKDSHTIIFDGDNQLVYSKIHALYPDRKLVSFGLKSHNDFSIASNSNASNEIVIRYLGEELIISAHQRDDATLSNALCVVSVLKVLGFAPDEIIKKINALKAVEMRLESVKGLRNNLIVNDSYNLDLDSLRIAYQFINEYNKPAKNLVLTDFVEGRDPERLYRDAAAFTNQQQFTKIFLVGEEIATYQGLFNGEIYTFDNTAQLINSHELDHIENELILLKGARKFEIERVKNHLELQKHDTVLEVNLNAILHNINFHKTLLRPETMMMAMVKAFSYGLGGYEIAEFLQHHHIDYLGVAYADEGVDLKKNGITTPIMVMNPEQHSYDTIIDYNLEPEIYSLRVLDMFSERVKQKGVDKNYPIHIKLETGMNRLGFKENELDQLISVLRKLDLKVTSIFSHLSSSDDPDENEFTLSQIEQFTKNSDYLIAGLGYQPLRHILNSSGIINFSADQFDMVRIGIGMVGVCADDNLKKKLRNAVSFKTVISQISEVNPGESVGYNRRHQPVTRTKIATLPVGYADGVPRMIGKGRGHVGIGGKLYPIVGSICMDMMMVDLDNSNAREGDEVIIFNSTPTLEEFSTYCQTIPYEVLTSVSRRVKRIYIKD